MKFRYFYYLIVLSSMLCANCHSMDNQKLTITLNPQNIDKLCLISSLNKLCNSNYRDADDNLVFTFSNFDEFEKGCVIYNKVFQPNTTSPQATSKSKNLYPKYDKDLTLAKNFYDAAGQQLYENYSGSSSTEPTLQERISIFIKKGK